MKTFEETLQRIKNDFRNYLKKIDSLTHMGEDVGDVVILLIESLNKEYKDVPGFIPFKGKLIRTTRVIKDIKNHPSLKEKYKIIYNHTAVLMVANFESFLSNLFKTIIDNFPDKINWPDKKIGVDLSLLKYSSPSVGDLVVKSLRGVVNFQDWQSILRFLKDYLDIDIEEVLSELEKEKVILYQSIRHIIIHRSGMIDAGFLKQIRNTRFYDNYKNGEGAEIEFDEESYGAAKNLFNKIVNSIVDALIKKRSD